MNRFPDVGKVRKAIAPAKPRREADVKKVVIDWLTLHNYRFWRMNSGAIFTGKRLIQLHPPGTPDVLVIYRGLICDSYREDDAVYGHCILWLEIKRPLGPKGGTGGSEQSPEQVQFQREAEAAGERYAIIRSMDDLERVMRT